MIMPHPMIEPLSDLHILASSICHIPKAHSDFNQESNKDLSKQDLSLPVKSGSYDIQSGDTDSYHDISKIESIPTL